MSLLLLLFFGFANGVLEHQPDDIVQIEESESQQILKELNVKWDAESAGIITFEVQYSRCHVAYINLKEFTANDVSLFVEKLVDKDSDEFFDQFFNYFVEPKSFEKPHPTSTQPFKSQIVSQNFFRYSGQRRWEKTVHPGNFMSNGEHILDFFDIYYTDDEKYINCSQMNKDLKIGNIANFHLLFAYLMDFLQQPEERLIPRLSIIESIRTFSILHPIEESILIRLIEIAVFSSKVQQQEMVLFMNKDFHWIFFFRLPRICGFPEPYLQ